MDVIWHSITRATEHELQQLQTAYNDLETNAALTERNLNSEVKCLLSLSSLSSLLSHTVTFVSFDIYLGIYFLYFKNCFGVDF